MSEYADDDWGDNYDDDDAPKATASKPAAVIIDEDSQYKIAKKKELLRRQLEHLRKNEGGSEAQQVIVDKVYDLLDQFEDEYKHSMVKELEEIQSKNKAALKQAKQEAANAAQAAAFAKDLLGETD